MVFSKNDFYTLSNFVGYGQVEADVWFVVINEKLDAVEELSQRLEFDQVMDKRSALSIFGKNIWDFDQSNLCNEGVGISKLYLRLGKRSITEALAKKYLQDNLFSNFHNGLFLPFFPIPENKEIITNFAEIFPNFTSYAKYREKIKKLRLEFFNELLAVNKPKLMVLLGKDQDKAYIELLKGKNLDDHGFFQAGWDTDMVIIKVNSLMSITTLQLDELSDFVNENCIPIDLKKEFGPLKLSNAELEKQKKDAAKRIAFEKRKTTNKHNPSDPYCVCEICLSYDR